MEREVSPGNLKALKGLRILEFGWIENMLLQVIEINITPKWIINYEFTEQSKSPNEWATSSKQNGPVEKC